MTRTHRSFTTAVLSIAAAVLLAGWSTERGSVPAAAGVGVLHVSRDATVAFAVEGTNADGVAVRRLDGGATRLAARLRPLDGKRPRVRSIVWNHAGTRLAFSDSLGRVYVVDADGRRARLLRRFGGGGVSVDDWSPDGRTLAVDTYPLVWGPDWQSWCRRGKLPHLYLVDVATAKARELSAYPGRAGNLRHRAADDPAVLDSVAFAPGGEELLYVWWQFPPRDCRSSIADTAVVTVRSDGTGRRVLFEPDENHPRAVWSPTGQSVAVLMACEHDDPFAWTGLDDSSIVIATKLMGCQFDVLDRRGKVVRKASFNQSPTQLLYSVDPDGRVSVLRPLGGRHDYWSSIGVLPGERTIVVSADQNRALLRLLPFDGSPLVVLPPLRAPAGMRVGEVSAVGIPSG